MRGSRIKSSVEREKHAREKQTKKDFWSCEPCGQKNRLVASAYLSCGGNIARTAEQLYVHRNTLVQRLDKLQELVGLDPHDSTHWLPLHIALGLWRLREP